MAPDVPLSKSMSQISSRAFLSFFFFFLEASSGGFSRDNSSDLLISKRERSKISQQIREIAEGGFVLNLRSSKGVYAKDTPHHTAKKDKSASQTEKRNTLSIRHISATVLKTTLEKLTVSRMVFMLGSCTSTGLCWGV